MPEIKKFAEVPPSEKEPVRSERSPEAVMEELSGEHYQPLLAFCSRELRQRRVPNPEDVALDIVQETMLKAWKNIKNIDPEKDVRNWLFKIAQNTMIDRQRSERLRPIAGAESLSAPRSEDDERTLEDRIGTPSFENQLLAREEIGRSLPLLDPGNADLIRWKYVEGLDNGDIAKKLGIGVRSVAGMIKAAEEQFSERRVN